MRPLMTALTSTCALIMTGCSVASAPANEIDQPAAAQLIEIVDFESQFVQFATSQFGYLLAIHRMASAPIQ